MEEKEILLPKVPQGKKAVWNEDGCLQLVDEEHEQPKDITERVKTFYDAQKVLEERAGNGDTKVKQLLAEYNAIDTSKASIDLVAFLQLRIVAAALNEGWRPTYSSEEPRYYPWFFYLSRKQYAALNDDIKKSYSVVESITGGYPYAIDCGEIASSMTLIACGPPLIFKTERLAVYCGKQFIDIWAKYLWV